MLSSSIRHVMLPSGESVPQLGQGTWQMAEHRGKRGDEIAALRAGLDLGLTLIDTAAPPVLEMMPSLRVVGESDPANCSVVFVPATRVCAWALPLVLAKSRAPLFGVSVPLSV